MENEMTNTDQKIQTPESLVRTFFAAGLYDNESYWSLVKSLRKTAILDPCEIKAYFCDGKFVLSQGEEPGDWIIQPQKGWEYRHLPHLEHKSLHRQTPLAEAAHAAPETIANLIGGHVRYTLLDGKKKGGDLVKAFLKAGTKGKDTDCKDLASIIKGTAVFSPEGAKATLYDERFVLEAWDDLHEIHWDTWRLHAIEGKEFCHVPDYHFKLSDDRSIEDVIPMAADKAAEIVIGYVNYAIRHAHEVGASTPVPE
jgi:hypothetical protein